ncbi:unnamed protein product [Chrysoparadoxa australica]
MISTSEQLFAAVQAYYGSATPSAECHDALQRFADPKTPNPRRLVLCLEVLHRVCEPPGHAYFYAGQVLEAEVAYGWLSRAPQERWEVRNTFFQLLRDRWSTFPHFVSAKLAKVLVRIGKLSWPAEDTAFVQDMLNLLEHEGTCLAGLFLLGILAEEVAREDLTQLRADRQQLLRAWEGVLPSILEAQTKLLTGVLGLGLGQGMDHNRRVALASEESLMLLIAASPGTAHLAPELWQALFSVVELAVSQNGAELQDCGACAVMCVVEALDKRLVAPQSQQFVLSITRHLLTVLEAITSAGNNHSACSHKLTQQLTHFLAVFFKLHLGRFMRYSTPEMLSSLLRLLAAFTFKQQDPELLQGCLLPWALLLKYLATHEETTSQEHASGLGDVCNALLRTALFTTNADVLRTLDAEEGSSRSTSDLQAFVAEVVGVVRSCALMPLVANKLAQDVLQLLEQVMGQLRQADPAELALDMSTLCGLLSMSASSCSQVYLKSVNASMEVCRHLLGTRQHSQGAAFGDMEVAALQALQALLPGLALASDQAPAATVTSLLDETIALITAVLADPSAAPTRLAACHLLRSIPRSLPPQMIAARPAVHSFFQGMHSTAASLPAPLLALAFEAHAGFLLPPQALAGGVKGLEGLEARSKAYYHAAHPFCEVLEKQRGQLERRGGSSAVDAGVVEAACASLKSLTSHGEGSPSWSKGVIHTAVAPSLPHAIALLPLCSAQEASAQRASHALLAFLEAVLRTLGREAGPRVATEVVQGLERLFESGQVAQGQQTAIVGAMYSLLAAAFLTPSKAMGLLAPQACSLCLGALSSRGPQHQLELLPELLPLAETLLDTQWGCFVSTEFKEGRHVSTVIPGAPSHCFGQLCSLLVQSIVGLADVPEVQRQAMALTMRLNEKRKLLALPAFTEFSQRLVAGCLGLLSGGEKLLYREEMMQLVYACAVVNLEWFMQLLPQHVSSLENKLQPGRRDALLALWGGDVQTSSGFISILGDFVHDLKVYMQ